MNIVLHRSVRVRRAHVVGQVAFPAKRVAEYAVIVWAAERLRRGLDASAELLSDADAEGPLLGFPKVVGARLIRVCEELRLVRREGERIVGLTVEGERVAQSEDPRLFVPQLGAWTLFWAEDPLLPHPLLRVEPWREPTAHADAEERKSHRGKPGGGDKPERPFKPTPRALLDLCDEQGIKPPLELPATQDGRPVRLASLENRAEIMAAEGELTLEIAFGPEAREGSMKLKGSVAGKSVDQRMRVLAGWDHARVWWELLRNNKIENLWNARAGKLRVQFRSLREDARTTFRQRIPFKAPEIAALGRFEDTVVEGVPIEPATQDDAQRWFEWLLAQRAQETQWPERFAHNTAELREYFPGFTIRVPAQNELARELWGDERRRPAYWHLQAPLDLDGGIR